MASTFVEGWLNGISGFHREDRVKLVFVKAFHAAKANDGGAIVSVSVEPVCHQEGQKSNQVRWMSAA